MSLRADLRARIGAELDQSVWQQLVDSGEVDYAAGKSGYASDEMDPGTADLRLRDLAEAYRHLASAPLHSAPLRSAPEPDLRASALARIAAAEANRSEDVALFRNEVLGGKLLAPDRDETWIRERAADEAEAFATFLRALRDLLEQSDAAPSDAVELVSPLTLVYVSGGNGDPWVSRQRVAPGGTLDRLRRLAADLARRYGWHEALATTVVLTGQVAPISHVRMSLRGSLIPAFERIVLDVSPRLSPNEVRDIYAEARAGMRGPGFRDRAVMAAQLELAVFAAEHNDGSATWQELAAEWNASGLGRHYDPEREWKQFASSARRAYNRVTGARLEWQRTKAEAKL